MTLYETIQAGTSVIMAIGVLVAARQLALSKQEAQSQFEDSLTTQYRKISRRLPLAVLLGKPLEGDALDRSLRSFYEYFDLSNEEAFLAEQGRLRPVTWRNWLEGIQQHLARPAFQQAWRKLEPDLDGSFDALRKILPESLGKTD